MWSYCWHIISEELTLLIISNKVMHIKKPVSLREKLSALLYLDNVLELIGYQFLIKLLFKTLLPGLINTKSDVIGRY